MTTLYIVGGLLFLIAVVLKFLVPLKHELDPDSYSRRKILTEAEH